MTIPSEITRAKREAQAARARLETTAETVKHRTSPAAIAGEVAGNARNRVAALGQKAGDTVRERPIMAGLAAALVGLLIVRKPAARLIRRRREKAEPPVPPPARVVRRSGPDAMAQFEPSPTSPSIFFQE